MPHRNKIFDTDAHFEVDAITRKIKNTAASKISLMQYDHNSERFTFTLPRNIEGHDMMESDKAEVHYINIATSGKTEIKGVYEMTDLKVDPEDETKVICSWLISQNATLQPGVLQFILRFSCVADDGTLEYVWNTGIFKGISVESGIDNGEAILEQYADVLEQWRLEYVLKTERNQPNGFAGLDEEGKLPAGLLPGYKNEYIEVVELLEERIDNGQLPDYISFFIKPQTITTVRPEEAIGEVFSVDSIIMAIFIAEDMKKAGCEYVLVVDMSKSQIPFVNACGFENWIGEKIETFEPGKRYVISAIVTELFGEAVVYTTGGVVG